MVAKRDLQGNRQRGARRIGKGVGRGNLLEQHQLVHEPKRTYDCAKRFRLSRRHNSIEAAMIIGAEVAMICLGLYALIKGKFPVNAETKFVVQGWPLRIMGLIYLLPIPVSLLAGMVLGVWWVAQGKELTDRSFFWAGTALEGAVVVVCLLAAAIVSRLYRVPVKVIQVDSAGV
jgi:hypothetical protein